MNSFVVIVTIALALMFGISAIGKLRAADHGARAFEALRVPLRRPEIAAVALVAVEGAVAVALIVTTGAALLGVASVATLLSSALVVAVIRARRLGSTEECGCFGEWLPSAIGPALIVRNAVLAAASAVLTIVLACAIVVGEPVGLTQAVTNAVSGDAATLWALGGAGIAVVITIASLRAVRGVQHMDDARSSAPVLRLADDAVIDLLAPAQRARLVTFLSSPCHACDTVRSTLEMHGPTLSSMVDLYSVYTVRGGDISGIRDLVPPAGVHNAVELGDSLSTALGIARQRPIAALISTGGEIVGPLAVGSDSVSELVDALLEASGANGPSGGHSAP